MIAGKSNKARYARYDGAGKGYEHHGPKTNQSNIKDYKPSSSRFAVIADLGEDMEKAGDDAACGVSSQRRVAEGSGKEMILYDEGKNNQTYHRDTVERKPNGKSKSQPGPKTAYVPKGKENSKPNVKIASAVAHKIIEKNPGPISQSSAKSDKRQVGNRAHIVVTGNLRGECMKLKDPLPAATPHLSPSALEIESTGLAACSEPLVHSPELHDRDYDRGHPPELFSDQTLAEMKSAMSQAKKKWMKGEATGDLPPDQ